MCFGICMPKHQVCVPIYRQCHVSYVLMWQPYSVNVSSTPGHMINGSEFINVKYVAHTYNLWGWGIFYSYTCAKCWASVAIL